jgi:hypothetical protein
VHWPISNGCASRHFQNFLIFRMRGRYKVGGA